MAQKVEWKLPDIVVDIKGNKDIYYENNRNLKRAEIQLAFTEEHREEFNKCANDIHYFAENYYHIRTLDEGIVKIKLRDYQKNMLDSFVGNRNTIVNATRQCVVGSTIVSIFDKQKSRFFDTPIENLFWILQDEDDEFSSNDKNRYAILSDEGYQDFEGILKRDNVDTLDIYLENGKVVSCSKDHVFFNEEYVELEAASLSLSDRLVTRHGIIGIKKIEDGKRESVYDACLSSNERYYTNDVLSHNCGKSTSFEIFTCWYILFNEQKSVALLANKAQSSLNILRKVKVAYELLPKWMQSGVVTWNASEIRLENGCHVMAAATSSSGIRSFSMNVCIIDEMAFISNSMWEDFFSSVYPTVSSSTESKTILVSTPNGLNHFWRYWNGAVTDDEKIKNDFNPIHIKWNEVPGRDEAWYKKTRANMSETEFNREFAGDFLGSNFTLVDINCLKNAPILPQLIDTDLHMMIPEFKGNLAVFEKVKKNHIYVLSCDSAKVHSDSVGDAVAIQVVDITRMPYKQVARFWAVNNMHYLQIPEVVYTMGKYYNWAYAFIENNEIGQEIADSVAHEFEYENIFYEKPNLAGYRTTTKTKRLGCSNLKGFIEQDKLRVSDTMTVEQLSTFIRHKNGTYSAEDGYDDDLVMSLMGCLFFLTRPEFDSFTERKDMAKILFGKETQSKIEEAMEADLPAFGIIDADGINDFDEDMSVF